MWWTLAGRHWAGLMLLAPGAINTGDGTHLSTRFVGRARDDNNWTFDGIDEQLILLVRANHRRQRCTVTALAGRGFSSLPEVLAAAG